MSESIDAFRGLYVDLIAPCDSSGRFLSREYHVHLRRMARVRDISGVVVNGPAGEAPALNHDLRFRILQTAMLAAPAGFPVFAAIPASIPDVDLECRAALKAGVAGIILLGGKSREDERPALETALESAGDVPVVAWNVSPSVIAEAVGVRAVIVDSLTDVASTGSQSVMLTDRSFNLDAIANGAVAGAVLASANIGEALWGRLFRLSKEPISEARTLLAERVGHLNQTLVEFAKHSDQQDRTMAAAIKYGLFAITQNTSEATLPPVMDIGEEARHAVSKALADGRLMPGMG